MATEQENLVRIRKMEYSDLQDLWSKHKSRDANVEEEWASGKLLEYLVLRAFELELDDLKEKSEHTHGYVTYPYNVAYPKITEKSCESTLEQIDGFICVNGLFSIVEFKDYESKKIDVMPLAKMRNILLRRHGNLFGMFFSTSSFTGPAQIQVQFMAPQIILLWEGGDIDYCIKHKCFIECMEWKYRLAIERCEYYVNFYQTRQIGVECEEINLI